MPRPPLPCRNGPPPITSTSQCAYIASQRPQGTAVSRPFPASGAASSPSSSSTSVARSNGSRADLHERVRLLLVGGEDPARPVAVDAPEAAEHAVANERRRQRVARLPLVLDAVEAEPHVCTNSFVAVSRTSSNQRRQPCVCTQRSLRRPFGLPRKKTNRAHSSSESADGVGRVGDVRLAAVRELGLVALAAPGAGDQQHQCATAAAPCSSISAPVAKRSSENGSFSSCGAPLAIVCANTRPDAGVALKPPVPQPQLRYRSVDRASGRRSARRPGRRRRSPPRSAARARARRSGTARARRRAGARSRGTSRAARRSCRRRCRRPSPARPCAPG